MSIFDKLMHLNDRGVVLLTPHIATWEYHCRHCGELPEVRSGGHGEAILALLHVFESIRAKWGKPIKITSGYRCRTHQLELIQKGYKAARYSPHEYGVALDITAGTTYDNEDLYSIITTSFPWLRVGFYKYDRKFIHIDTAPLLPFDVIPHAIVEINGQKYHVAELWGKEGARW